ncbi:MAG: (5-formylfuran-3-yl)methyl phosphate synthase [Pirellulales bacterium]
MTHLPGGLLVSVRSVDEAAEAVAGGAVIVDVKEPGRGPLGCADADVAAAIVAFVGSAGYCTLACGELAAGVPVIAAHVDRVMGLGAVTGTAPRGAKAGPAGLAVGDWQSAFAALAHSLPAGVEPVAVAYADWSRANAPEPEALIAAAAAVGAVTILIDTSDKAGPGLVAACGLSRLTDWVARARDVGMRVALAGRLEPAEIRLVAASGAAIVGVRSAACRGGRMGRVDRGNVAALASTLGRSGQQPVDAILGEKP